MGASRAIAWHMNDNAKESPKRTSPSNVLEKSIFQRKKLSSAVESRVKQEDTADKSLIQPKKQQIINKNIVGNDAKSPKTIILFLKNSEREKIYYNVYYEQNKKTSTFSARLLRPSGSQMGWRFIRLLATFIYLEKCSLLLDNVENIGKWVALFEK